jgi:hypothetical protein
VKGRRIVRELLENGLRVVGGLLDMDKQDFIDHSSFIPSRRKCGMSLRSTFLIPYSSNTTHYSSFITDYSYQADGTANKRIVSA